MNFKLQVSTGYSEVFETNPSQLKSINLTTALLCQGESEGKGEGIRIKHHFVNSLIAVQFTDLCYPLTT